MRNVKNDTISDTRGVMKFTVVHDGLNKAEPSKEQASTGQSSRTKRSTNPQKSPESRSDEPPCGLFKSRYWNTEIQTSCLNSYLEKKQRNLRRSRRSRLVDHLRPYRWNCGRLSSKEPKS